MSTVRYVPHPRETRDVSRGFAALPSLAFQWGPAGSRIGRASTAGLGLVGTPPELGPRGGARGEEEARLPAAEELKLNL